MPEDRQLDFDIRRADWEHDRARLQAIRRQVFVHEQGVPEDLEWDGSDTGAVHLLAEDRHGTAIGTARLLPSGQIGRMAVLRAHRRRGVGRALLLTLLRIARADAGAAVFLNAQVSALPFYASVGFEAEGETFDEAGIPHRRMRFADPQRLLIAELRRCRLGHSPGRLRLASAVMQREGVGRLAAQSQSELLISTPDLEPALYDRPIVLETMLRLAVHRGGRVPVRVLVMDAEQALKRGHRLIELSRRFSSAIQLRALPEDLVDGAEACLLADAVGYGLRPSADRDSLLLDFADSGQTRRLRRRFELLWQESRVHPGLRRLYL
jgi:predicted GNAT family N-acyltransferase